MKRIVFLLFLFPLLSFACNDHPEASKDQPMWLKYLVEASGEHKQHPAPKHLDLKANSKAVKKKDINKADQ